MPGTNEFLPSAPSPKKTKIQTRGTVTAELLHGLCSGVSRGSRETGTYAGVKTKGLQK